MKIYRLRLTLVFSLILIISSILLIRLVYLFTVQKNFLEQQGDARTIRTVSIPAYRGLILDRFGQPMAVSTEVATIWVNPSIISSDANLTNYNYEQVNHILDLPVNYLQSKVNDSPDKEFIYLKRKLAPDLAFRVQSLDLPGIFIKKEFKRYYPNGEVSSHITGFTSIDEVGQEGIEQAYEQELKAIPGRQQVLKDRFGRTVKTIKQQKVAKAGQDIQLSIDMRLQYLTYTSLKQAIEKHNAQAGIAVILDIKTGEILALANQPSFNPNDRRSFLANEIRNRAITDLFEPGSLLKPISMAAALSTKKFTDDMIIDTNPGVFNIGSHKVKDIINYGKLNLEQIIKKSSNIGITKLTLASEPSNLINLLYNMGFARSTALDLQGEANGWINDIRDGEDFKLATLAFGYGISVTPLQLLQAYSIFANHGKLVPMTLLKKDQVYKSYTVNQIIEPEIADKILSMLNSVMQKDGTGRLAMIPNYSVSGKTGTSRRVTENGYDENSHNAMFVGLVPYPKPKLAMLVFIVDPKTNGYYGGMVAGPVFRQVMTRALQLYGIPPDAS